MLVSVTSAATIHAPKGVHGSVLKQHHEGSHVTNPVETARVDAEGNVMLTEDAPAERPRPRRVSNVALAESTTSDNVLRAEASTVRSEATAAVKAPKTDAPEHSSKSEVAKEAAVLETLKKAAVGVLRTSEEQQNTLKKAPVGVFDNTLKKSAATPEVAPHQMESKAAATPQIAMHQVESKAALSPQVALDQMESKVEGAALAQTSPVLPKSESDQSVKISAEEAKPADTVVKSTSASMEIRPHAVKPVVTAAVEANQKKLTLIEQLNSQNVSVIAMPGSPMGVASEIIKVLGDVAIDRIKKKKLSHIEKQAILASLNAGLKEHFKKLKPAPAQRTIDSAIKGLHRRFSLLLDNGYVGTPPLTHSQKASMRSWITLLVVLPLAAMFCFWLMDSQKPIPTDYEERLVEQRNNENNAQNDWKHLSGLRFVGILWVFWSHSMGSCLLTGYQCNGNPDDCRHAFVGVPKFWSDVTVKLLAKGFVAVNFFLVLSGFVLLASKDSNNGFTSIGDCLRFYKRRIGKIAPPYWLAVAIMFILWHPSLNIVTPIMYKHGADVDTYNRDAIFTFSGTQSWTAWKFTPSPQEGLMELLDVPAKDDIDAFRIGWSAGPLWFVSCLLFAWLMFPFMYKVLEITASDYTTSRPTMAIIISYILSVTPQLVSMAIWGEDLATLPTFQTVQWNILCTLPQFVFGMCVGNLLRINSSDGASAIDCPGWLLSLCGDLCLLAIPIIAIFVPMYTGSAAGYEVFWTSGLGFLSGGVLYFTCHPRCGPGLVKSVIGSPFFCRLGEYSFYIFALHIPINQLVDGCLFGFPAPFYPAPWLTSDGHPADGGMKLWCFYLFVNIFVAAFCTEVIEKRCAIFFPAKSGAQEGKL